MIGCDTVAVEVIPTIRKVANKKPLLQSRVSKVKETGAAEPVSRHVEEERERRRVERGFYEQLSRYYPRREGKWQRTILLSVGKYGSIK
jgi:hypothetical protein